jgi:hypothetical protein
MAFDKKSWREENREKARLHSARYRLRKKGLDLPPETLAGHDLLEKKMLTHRQQTIIDLWDGLVDDDMSTEYAIQYIADVAGVTHVQVISALYARAMLEENNAHN